jgi:hypothetical protein
MARFRGLVQGGRGEVSRLGHRSITTDANGWNLGVNVDGGAFDVGRSEIGGDHFTVYATGGSTESRRSHAIARVEEVPNEDGGTDRRITLFGVKGEVVEVYTA